MLKEFLEKQIENRAFPGAALLVTKNGETVTEEYLGKLSYESENKVNGDTRYDLASVTKTFTSACVALLAEREQLSLDEPAVKYLPELYGEGKDSITIKQLCTHTAGLFGNPELHKELPERDELFLRFFTQPLLHKPSEHVFYTSVGYQFLGLIIERISGMNLSEFMKRNIFAPLGLNTISFTPEDKRNIAPTEFSVFRNRVCLGEVHDDNCYVLGEVCGHAGLFSTARDVAAFGEMLIRGGSPVFKEKASLKALFESYTDGLEQERSIGFIVNNPAMGKWACDTYYHTGFTGTSLFLVPKHKLVAVLLTNRVCPTRQNEKIVEARLGLHSLLARMLGEEVL